METRAGFIELHIVDQNFLFINTIWVRVSTIRTFFFSDIAEIGSVVNIFDTEDLLKPLRVIADQDTFFEALERAQNQDLRGGHLQIV